MGHKLERGFNREKHGRIKRSIIDRKIDIGMGKYILIVNNI